MHSEAHLRRVSILVLIAALLALSVACGPMGEIGEGEDEWIEDVDEDVMDNEPEGIRHTMGTCPVGGDYPPTIYDVQGGIESYSGAESERACDPTAKPGVKKFRDFVLATYPCTRSGGIVRACSVGGASAHKQGKAWDWMVNHPSPAAEQLISWLLATDSQGNKHAMARRIGLRYMIWNGKIWSSYGSRRWETYYGASAHRDHIHFSFSNRGASGRSSFWTHAKSPICRQADRDAIATNELFKDMPRGSTGYSEAEKLFNAGISDGCQVSPVRLFCAKCSLTRGQMATLLVRAIRTLDPASAARLDQPAPSFTDVPSTHTFYKEIRQLAAAKITLGCNSEGTQFCPDEPVTRGQMAAFIVRARQWELDYGYGFFADVSSSHAMYPEIETAYLHHISDGCKSSPLEFCPGKVINRAQAAVFIARAYNM